MSRTRDAGSWAFGFVACLAAMLLTAAMGDASTAQPGQAPASTSDVVARLDRQIESGAVTLPVDEHHPMGRLRGLLAQLDVSIDSQTLVFSKTSFQSPHIIPRTPRALYFNDDVYVGAVQNGDVFELIATDRRDGLAFYTMNAHASSTGRFERRHAECTTCHGTSLMVQSVLPGPDGDPLAFVGGGPLPTIDHRTPLESRWGGWYVTGTHGAVEHMGNAVVRDPTTLIALETEGTQNRLRLDDKIDTAAYLAPTSDIVALMTLEHQTRMATLMNRVARLGRDQTAAMPERVAKQVDTAIDEMLAYMLFTDEVPLHEPVRGVSTFTQTFAKRGPRDEQGRSLRDFDLQRRLFRYPLSYMIYSDAFAAIPDPVRARVNQRLFDILTGRLTSPPYDRLPAADRTAVQEIVRATKPELAAYWNTP